MQQVSLSYSHRVIRKFLYLLSAQWMRDALRTIFLIYLARHNTTTYGEFMLALGMSEVLLFIAEFGLNQHLVSVLSKKESDPIEALIHVSILKGSLLTLGWLGAWAIACWQGYSPSLKALMFVIGAGVGLEALASSFFVAFQVQGRQDLEGRVKMFGAGAGFGYGLSMIYFGFSAVLVAFFKLAETSVNLAGVLLLTARRTTFRFRGFRFSAFLKLGKGSIVLSLMAVAAILYNKTNLFFLQRYAGPDAVAQYSATWEIVDGISCIASNLLLKNILFPLFVNLWDRDRSELSRLVQDAARWLLIVSFPIMFVLMVESDRIITLVYGTGYGDAVWMQKYLTATILIGFIHNLAAYLMISMRREQLLLAYYVGGMVFNFILCAVIIPQAPLMGTVLSIVITKAVVAVLTVSFCQKHFGLVPLRPLLYITGAAALSLIIYYFGHGLVQREVAALAALAPVLALGGRWWMDRNRMIREAEKV